VFCLIVVSHSFDDISLFVTFGDIPESPAICSGESVYL
jgi:hypothetical protein